MNDLLYRIYDEIIYYDKESIKRLKIIDEKIIQILEPYQGRLSQSELEILKNLLYEIALPSEREGFRLGVKCIIDLLCEIS